MTRVALAKVYAAAPHRKPGYLDAVMAAAKDVSETHLTLEAEDFNRLRSEYGTQPQKAPAATPPPAPTHGPGVELKKLLKLVGITATPNCSCNARARKMDEEEAKEPGWCTAHLDEIVGWLREEATKRKLPFLDAAGRVLVRRAISNARREQARAEKAATAEGSDEA
jgi:hypothetical protein